MPRFAVGEAVTIEDIMRRNYVGHYTVSATYATCARGDCINPGQDHGSLSLRNYESSRFCELRFAPAIMVGMPVGTVSRLERNCKHVCWPHCICAYRQQQQQEESGA